MGGVISFSCDPLYPFVYMVKVNRTFIIVETKKIFCSDSWIGECTSCTDFECMNKIQC